MLHMSDLGGSQILSGTEGPVADVVNASGTSPICLVCEHSSNVIPASLGDLGLAAEDRFSHAVWDIGAEALARDLAQRLDAPLVLSRVSRLVYDCNRPPERRDSIPDRVEEVEVPGNRGLSAEERAARVSEIHDRFHATVEETLDGFVDVPALLTIHSFTPTWYGVARPAEIGILHDSDADLANRMLAHAGPHYRTELNVPYSVADGVTHTLRRHAGPRGIPNAMIEVRNDFLAAPASIAGVAEALEIMMRAALNQEDSAA